MSSKMVGNRTGKQWDHYREAQRHSGNAPQETVRGLRVTRQVYIDTETLVLEVTAIPERYVQRAIRSALAGSVKTASGRSAMLAWRPKDRYSDDTLAQCQVIALDAFNSWCAKYSQIWLKPGENVSKQTIKDAYAWAWRYMRKYLNRAVLRYLAETANTVNTLISDAVIDQAMSEDMLAEMVDNATVGMTSNVDFWQDMRTYLSKAQYDCLQKIVKGATQRDCTATGTGAETYARTKAKVSEYLYKFNPGYKPATPTGTSGTRYMGTFCINEKAYETSLTSGKSRKPVASKTTLQWVPTKAENTYAPFSCVASDPVSRDELKQAFPEVYRTRTHSATVLQALQKLADAGEPMAL